MRLSPHFTLSELTQTSTGRDNTPTDTEIGKLQVLVDEVLEPLRMALGVSVRVTSGYRSPEVNAAVGGAASSQHTEGEAADIWVEGMAAEDLARKIVGLGLVFDQLIVERAAPAERWVHVSYRAGRCRNQMLRKTAGGYVKWAP